MSPLINFSALQQVLQNGLTSLLFIGTVGGILLVAIIDTLVVSRREARGSPRWSLRTIAFVVLVLAAVVIGLRYGNALPNVAAH